MRRCPECRGLITVGLHDRYVLHEPCGAVLYVEDDGTLEPVAWNTIAGWHVIWLAFTQMFSYNITRIQRIP